MNIQSDSKPWRAMSLAAILSVGALAVWLVACGLGASVVDQFSRRAYERLVVTRDAKAYIVQTRMGGDAQAVNTYRTLDGKPLEISFFMPDGSAVTPAWLAAEHDESFPPPKADWMQRIVGFRDSRTPATYWYLVHDGRQPGLAYFVGYDSTTKRLVGYLGRQGFSAGLPSEEEQFADVPVGGYAAQSSTMGNEPNWLPGGNQVVYLNSSGTLLAVDLDQRGIRTVSLPAPVVSLTLAYKPIAVAPATPIQVAPREPEIIVRTNDQLIVLNLQGETVRSLNIPDALRDSAVQFYECLGPEIVLATTDWRGSMGELFWINAQGQTTRKETYRLVQGPSGASDAEMWLIFAVFLPAPVLVGVVLTTIAPESLVATEQASDYWSALAQTLAQGWVPCLLVCLVSAALAIFVYRRHRRWEASGATAWAVFVFLAGPFGLAGYWLHRRWPVREKCGKCCTLAPRDRDECLACAETFPLPAPRGIEIFA